jgi:tetratricopeptide (TPR) repeat protein
VKLVDVIVSSELSKLSIAELFFRNKEYKKALEACSEYIKENPDDAAGLRLLGDIESRNGDLLPAIRSFSKTIALSKNPEPCDFFSRGRLKLKIGQISSACDDFKEIIQLCAKYNNNYYLGAAYLYLAYTNAKIGKIEDAEVCLAHLDDDCVAFIDGHIVNIESIKKMLK